VKARKEELLQALRTTAHEVKKNVFVIEKNASETGENPLKLEATKNRSSPKKRIRGEKSDSVTRLKPN